MKTEKPASVDAYLKSVSGPNRTALENLRKTIKSIIPESAEGLSYGMPAFKVNGKSVAAFMAFQNHLSYFPMSGTTLRTLKHDLKGYEQTKSALHFTADQPLPKPLVGKLIAARLAEIDA